MSKYDYVFNNQVVSRNVFYKNLKNHSQTTRTYNVNGDYYKDFGIDVSDFDKKKFNSYKRKLFGSNGRVPTTLVFVGDRKADSFSIKNRGRR